MHKSFRLLSVLIGSALACVPCCFADSVAQARADAAIDSLYANLWNSSTQNFRGNAGYWIYAQTMDIAAMAVARNRPKYQNYVATLYKAQNSRGWHQGTNTYYDDENWMALSLTRAYQITQPDPAAGEDPLNYLSTAESLYSDIMGAVVKDASGNFAGIRWHYAQNGRATASNAGPVITGLLLAKQTGNSAYSRFALQVYDFWFNKMVDKTRYRVADFLNPDGSIIWADWTYDNGLMVGAALQLYKASGNGAYLTQARGFASYILTHESVSTKYGPALKEVVCGNNCSGDATEFKGIALRYLIDLLAVDSANTGVRNLVNGTLASLWYASRSSQTGLFGIKWEGDAPAFNLGAQNSAALALGNAAALNLTANSSGTSTVPRATDHCDYSSGDCYNDLNKYAYLCALYNGTCGLTLNFYWNPNNAPPVLPASVVQAPTIVHCDYSTGSCYNDRQSYAYLCNLRQGNCPAGMVYYWNSSSASPVKPTIHCDYSSGNCYNDANHYAYYCNLDQRSCLGGMVYYWNSNDHP
jgi:predicted alpha-1,6-mannanase (GH76 family)